MAISDEIYLKYHVSQLRDLNETAVKLWEEGQDRWLERTNRDLSDSPSGHPWHKLNTKR